MAASGEDGWERFSPVDRAMGRRMERALKVPLTMEWTIVDVVAALAETKRLRGEGLPATFNSLVVLATARGLEQFPMLAASVDYENWTKKIPETPNLGVAVASERGLVVPVLSEATKLAPADVIAKLDELVRAARSGSPDPALFKGSDITVTNMGNIPVYGGFPIPNLPEIAIVGTSGAWDAAVVRDGEIVASKQMRLTVGMDHRALDGITVGGFLVAVKDLLEDPRQLTEGS
jgi:pyruvate/2-oxoglutarate dehydrogenase complex dihydrolipoamide acyltransferase (E2) component